MKWFPKYIIKYKKAKCKSMVSCVVREIEYEIKYTYLLIYAKRKTGMIKQKIMR